MSKLWPLMTLALFTACGDKEEDTAEVEETEEVEETGEAEESGEEGSEDEEQYDSINSLKPYSM